MDKAQHQGNAAFASQEWISRAWRLCSDADLARGQARMVDVDTSPPPAPKLPRRLPQRPGQDRRRDLLSYHFHWDAQSNDSDDEVEDVTTHWWKRFTRQRDSAPFPSPRGFPTVLDIGDLSVMS